MIRHCRNSGGIVNYPEFHLDMVRAGVLIYGLVPDKACEGKIDLKPAMQLHSVISMIKEVKAGQNSATAEPLPQTMICASQPFQSDMQTVITAAFPIEAECW